MLREVTTKYGKIKGLPAADPRITSFKGIPFAAPPVGENRWRAPQPCKSWDGVLEAYQFAPISVQNRPGLGTDIYCREWHVDPEVTISEDCLYLNVWTPAKKTDEKLPVLVWYFGGGLQWGYPSEMEFDGERIARRGVIVVSVNYRLNVFGFLAHPEITKENPDAPTNFGYLDQQAGTRWVYENIEAFGGDPEKITIAGQSAGGGSVLCQIANPANKGLIKGAVIMSATISNPFADNPFPVSMDLAEGEKYGQELFELMGVSSLEEARKLDQDTVLAKYDEYVANHPRLFSIKDDKFCFGDPIALLMEGKGLDIPVIAGNTADEFLNGIFAGSKEEFEQKAKDTLGINAAEFLKFESANKNNGPLYSPVSGIEITAKSMFECMTKNTAGSKKYYYYRFNPDIPGWDNPGTFHSVDLWFWFETLAKCWRPFKGRHYDLARQMCNYFVNFIKTGDPNGPDADGTPMQEWIAYDAQNRFEMEFTADGPVSQRESDVDFKKFLKNQTKTNKLQGRMKKLGFNPYLPSWEYVPDGEPYVFGDRVYIYGSHDKYNGDVFCIGDYVCYSAPIDNLGDWKYEGVIYGRQDDPNNPDNDGCLYAPDVTVGPDGRYYLYYVMSHVGYVSVAVCDTPAGKYKFYGYVHYADGTRVGDREGDEPQFDPGVLTEGNRTYLYTGFCGFGDKSRHGAQAMVLDADMLTVIEEPKIIVPGSSYGEGTEFFGHEYFEAASIRKMGDKYIFVYSSRVMHELAYAVSDKPTEGFKYGGVLVSNADLGIDSYKPSDLIANFGANNHGSIIEINGQWYVFYHRHTNGTWYSRQVCAEPLKVEGDGIIRQSEITSCGLNNGPLPGKGYFPAYIACNLMYRDGNYAKNNMCIQPMGGKLKIVQDGGDGDENEGYIANFADGAIIGYKYFDFKGVKSVSFWCRGYAHGDVEIRTAWDGEAVGKVRVDCDNRWKMFTAELNIPDGVAPLYFCFIGGGNASFRGFTLD